MAGESRRGEKRDDESENPECEPAEGPKRNETTMGGKGDGEGEPVSIECECRAPRAKMLRCQRRDAPLTRGAPFFSISISNAGFSLYSGVPSFLCRHTGDVSYPVEVTAGTVLHSADQPARPQTHRQGQHLELAIIFSSLFFTRIARTHQQVVIGPLEGRGEMVS